MSFLGFANYYREFIKGYADKLYPMQKLMRNKGKKFEWNEESQAAFENIKRELCEAPALGMPTEKGMYVLDTDASVEAISGILHQEQEWNGRTVLRLIAYGSKVLSDTEMKYGAPKAEMFAVVTFVEKYRAYLGSAPFMLRVDNRALSWLKTYSMDQSYFGRWIVRLDDYHLIIEHRMRDKQQNADSGQSGDFVNMTNSEMRASKNKNTGLCDAPVDPDVDHERTSRQRIKARILTSTKLPGTDRVTPPLVTPLVDNGASIEEALTNIVGSIREQIEQMSLKMSELEMAVHVERENLREEINRNRQEVSRSKKT